MTKPRLLATAAALVLGGVSACFATAGSADAASTSDAVTYPAVTQGCTPLKPAQTRLIGADGKAMSLSAAPALRATAATELTYATPDGSTLSTIVPPSDFRPQTAAPATARAYGFDAPDNPAALAAWRARYQGYRSTVASVPCVAPDVPSSRRISYSSNWGGYVANGHSNYVEAYADVNIPTFTTACGSNANTMTSPWIGLGGFSSTAGLIQQGFDAGSSASATTGARLWYEYLNSAHQNPLVYIGSTTRTGDVISQYVTYSGGTAAFHWYDRTTGTGWTPVTKTGLSSYYNGATADFITEDPYGTLRHFSRETFSAAGAAYGSTFADLFNLPNTEVRLTSNGASSGTLLIADTHSTSSSFYQDFKHC